MWSHPKIATYDLPRRDAILRFGLAHYEHAWRAHDPADNWDDGSELHGAFCSLNPAQLKSPDERRAWLDVFGSLDELAVDVRDISVFRDGTSYDIRSDPDTKPRFTAEITIEALPVVGDDDDGVEFIRIETGKGGRQLHAVSKKRARMV